jgi:hypothetical protein
MSGHPPAAAAANLSYLSKISEAKFYCAAL